MMHSFVTVYHNLNFFKYDYILLKYSEGGYRSLDESFPFYFYHGEIKKIVLPIMLTCETLGDVQCSFKYCNRLTKYANILVVLCTCTHLFVINTDTLCIQPVASLHVC